MKKNLIFNLVLLILIFLVIDTMLFITLRQLDKSKTIFYDNSNVSKARIDYWLNNSFDPELGWDQPKTYLNYLGSRNHKVYKHKPLYKLKAFGDSFTQGTGVEDNETWEAYLEQLTGWDCLNFGVQGYGVDQAFLKYKRIQNPKSQYTILAMHIENIARVVSVYPAFYMGGWGPPKPYYILLNEEIRLMKSPVINREDAYKLLDKDFIEEMRLIDYWANFYEKVRGSPRRLTWPATWMGLRHFHFFYNRFVFEVTRKFFPSYALELKRSRYYHLYKESSTAFKIVKKVINQFMKLCHERGEVPIIVIFPSQHSLDVLKVYKKSLYSSLVIFLEEKKSNFINFGSIFVAEDYSRYYLSYDGHFSPEGNERVAIELVKFIKELRNENLTKTLRTKNT